MKADFWCKRGLTCTFQFACLSANGIDPCESGFMKRDDNIGHIPDLDHHIVRFIGIDVGSRHNNLHLHGSNLGRRVKILLDHTETGDGGITLGGIDKDVIPPGVWMGVA